VGTTVAAGAVVATGAEVAVAGAVVAVGWAVAAGVELQALNTMAASKTTVNKIANGLVFIVLLFSFRIFDTSLKSAELILSWSPLLHV
jgi:hypothetical protein